MVEQNGRTHSQVVELLSAYIDGEVTAEEWALVGAHLKVCPVCAHDLATLRQTVALLRELPQVAAPRPLTLRESDIRPVRPARPAWWRLPWMQGAVAAAAVLLCVVVAGGVWLLGRTGLRGMPAAPAPLAFEALAPTEVAADEVVVEKVEVEKEVEKAVEAPAPAPTPAPIPTAAAEVLEEEGVERKEPALEQAVPAEAAQAESEAITGEEELPAAAAPPLATPAPQPTTTPSMVAAPTPTGEAGRGADVGAPDEATPMGAGQSPTGTPLPAAKEVGEAPALMEVKDLRIEIEPGVVRVSGRLPLPAGRRLAAELWRDGYLTDWATPEDEPVIVGADGQFSLRLHARPAAPDFDLFAIEPASYEVRIHPVDPPEPLEARIPFDTYGPPSPEPTQPSAGSLKDEAQATSTVERVVANAPTEASPSKGEVPSAATFAVATLGTTAVIAPRTTMLLVGLAGVGLAVLLLAGLAAVFLHRARR